MPVESDRGPNGSPPGPPRSRLTAPIVLGSLGLVLGLAGLLLPRVLPGMPRDAGIVLVVGALMLVALAVAHWGSGDAACDAASPALRRSYFRGLMGSMSAYVVVLCASIWLLKRVDPLPLRAAIALAPMLPIGFAIRAMVRYVRGLDEMQQRIELEAVSVATVLVSMLYMTGGLLQSAGLLRVSGEVAMIWVFPLVTVAYGVAKGFVARRYG